MVEGIAVALFPSVADECGDQQQEGALGLVEIGDETIDDMILVAGGYHELCLAVEAVGVVALQPGEDVFKCLIA